MNSGWELRIVISHVLIAIIASFELFANYSGMSVAKVDFLLKFSIHFLQEADERDSLLDQKHMTLEFASISDGKEAVAKGGNVLFMKYSKLANSGAEQKEQIFTEANMTEALRAVGLFYFSICWMVEGIDFLLDINLMHIDW